MIYSIPKLLSILHNESRLFEALFEKRNRFVSEDEVLHMASNPDMIESLLDSELLIRTEDTIELDERVLLFFEEFLDANTDVEIGDIAELLENLSHNISMYDTGTVGEQKDRKLGSIKRILKKIPHLMIKNLSLLQHHISLVYKTQSSHQHKLAELNHYKGKLEKLSEIEKNVDKALLVHYGFFQLISDYETQMLYYRLKERLKELRISLIELHKQVIEYINKTLQNTSFYEHILRLKTLKNSMEIKEKTNIVELLDKEDTPLFLAKRIHYSVYLETGFAYEEAFEKMIDKLRQRTPVTKVKMPLAGAIEAGYLEQNEDELLIYDLDSLHREFMQTSEDLFSFVLHKRFEPEREFGERLQLFCQMALMYEEEYHFEEVNRQFQEYEYLVIYPKESR